MLRVLSLNIWHDAGPWEARLAAIRSGIVRHSPDLIGFQEVLVGGGTDLAAQIVEGLGYETEFVGASDFFGRKGLRFGNAVASRFPIRSRNEIALPDAGDGETRAALSVTVEAPFGDVSITSTHLNWKLHHGHVRERQVVALCDHVRAQRPGERLPPDPGGRLQRRARVGRDPLRVGTAVDRRPQRALRRHLAPGGRRHVRESPGPTRTTTRAHGSSPSAASTTSSWGRRGVPTASATCSAASASESSA